jgi:hypothetical protein
MSKKVFINIILIAAIALATAGTAIAARYYADLPERLSQHETIVLGQNRLSPGSQPSLRVLVRDSANGAPLADAEVNVSLQPAGGGTPQEVFRGKTDSLGNAAVSFVIPAGLDAKQVMVIETRSKLGADKIERPITLERDYRVLLSSDKPIYQPGQVIHLRALALGTFDLAPAAGQPLEVTIADGKGNKVFRQVLTANDYGVAAVDFTLASEVNSGAYKISAVLGNTTSEKTVTVEHYVLPKFAIILKTDRSYYLPGERVSGSLNAAYFFGKPVSGGEVLIEGYTYDFERVDTARIQSQTDDEGNLNFEFDLPAYIAGSDLESGRARYYLQVSVTDLAAHTEVTNLSLPVAGNALIIDAIPEGGRFRPGVENILYVLTSYPDGTPAPSRVQVELYESGQTLNVDTGGYGLAEVRFTPQSPYQWLVVQAVDETGRRSQREFGFEGPWSEESVLLRPDRPVYRVGESMVVTLLTSVPSGSVYLDITRAGQTLSTRTIPVENGRGQAVIDLTADMYGTLELHAYKILRSGSIVRDTRLVVVDQAEQLLVQLEPGKDTYRPGEDAHLDILVQGSDGSGALAALGLAIVDESVFALAEQDPGFAKLYFMLERELLAPKYDLHGFSVPDLIRGLPSEDPQLRQAVDGAAQASLSAASVSYAGRSPFSLQANSHEDAVRNAQQKQTTFFTYLSKILYGLLLALPLALLILTGWVLWKQKTLGRGVLIGVGILVIIAILFLIWPLGPDADWVRTPLDRMEWLHYHLSYNTGDLLTVSAIFAAASFLTLMVIAVLRKDTALGWTLMGLILFAAVAVGTIYAATMSNANPRDFVLIAGLIAFASIPLTLLLRAGGFFARRQVLAGVAGAILAIFLLLSSVPLAATGAASTQGGMRAMDGVVIEQAVMAGALPPMATAVPEAARDTLEEAAGSGTAAGEPPRLRQYFPETMLWLPDLVTDENGNLSLEFAVADSITTWRMTALASTQDGRIGSATAGLRVFQDFFIDLDLPLALTVGDEIAIPVGVFNYLTEAQTVRLELEEMGWFELLDEPIKEIQIGANDIHVVYFRIRALDFGQQPFKVTAWGSQMSDAIQKEVRVFPDGKLLTLTQSDRLIPGEVVREEIFLPAETIPGTQKLLVKIYPGILSQVVEGLDSLLRMPFGCFEQTSSTTYPNVLVLDYLRSTGQAAPEVELKAEQYINLGYQRLTTFEVQSSGGFSLFGDAPADRMLTAYGLQEFADMSRVAHVDADIIARAGDWLLSQQAADGSWENDKGLVHESTWSSLGNERLPVTAYIAWSLVEAGFGDEAQVKKAIEYIRERQSQAEDAYVLALVANALVAADKDVGVEISPSTEVVLDRLAALAKQDGTAAWWESGVATFMGSQGKTNSIETSALAALALLRADRHPELANAALTGLVREKDSYGTWYSTQATVMTLKALLESVRSGAEDSQADVTIRLNGGQTRTLQVNPQNFDVVQMVAFDDINLGRENLVEIEVQGKGNLMYQISGSYYLPWDSLASYPELFPGGELVMIDVRYDRTELTVNDTVQVNVQVELAQPGARAESAIVDLGLPPGFSVEASDLAALVAYYNDTPEDYAFARIQRYELTGRQIIIYITNLSADQPLEFSYRLRAKYPLIAQTPATIAYDYYNPDVTGEQVPLFLTVKE